MRAARAASLLAWRGWLAVGLVVGFAFVAGCPQPKSAVCPSGRVCQMPYTCAANQDICILGNCGNGIIDMGEKCDDGNVVNDDSCNKTCSSDNSCGNGIKDDTFDDPTKDEACDDGSLNGTPMHCSFDCKSNGQCGNGIVDTQEECDVCSPDDAAIDSGMPASDGPMSIDAAPGDGPGDDGDAADVAEAGAGSGGAGGSAGASGSGGAGGSANNSCGLVESRTCNFDCSVARCGDRKINHAAGEQCDDGGESKACNVDCTLASCGDGKVNRTLDEECDVQGGQDTRNCNGAMAASAGVACLFSRCGDGYVNTAAGETCDNGDADTKDCNGSHAPDGVACRAPRCGDNYVNAMANEDCDNSGGADTTDCNGSKGGAVACRTARCGDGYPNSARGETCEVGSDGKDTTTCNGTSAGNVQCHLSTCNDGYINMAALEQCDPGTSGADNAHCNGTTAGALKCQSPVCGDGYLNTQAGEACDDHNMTPGDGCNASCQKEGGFTCTSASPSACASICGDGLQVNPEKCDDFNNSSCGGCSATCGTVQAPSSASGSITAVGSGSFSNGDSFTLSDGVHASVTFEITNKTPGSGHVAIARGTNSDAPTIAGRIVSAINGVGAPLAINASNSGAQITLSNSIMGAAGNVPITTTIKASSGFGVVGMHNGAAYDCGAGVGCGANSDCASGLCCLTGTQGGTPCTKNQCLGSLCNDGVQNGTETSIDCGGVSCGPCIDGKPCLTASDCTSGVCDKTCQTPTCDDGVKNGTETDVDCGTVCLGKTCSGAACTCSDNAGCSVGGDCTSGVCTGGVCQPPACNDHVQNGTEADVDCGVACPGQPCANTSKCVGAADCASGICTSGTCRGPTCNDGFKNQGEAGIDCGGPCPLLCKTATCTADAQCKSNSCSFPDAGASPDGGDAGPPAPGTCD